ncbi:MAG: hypothetical protein IIZ24_01350, partial [Candidatus Methanomethylophilus sp.]|nr:hypothetical protein [Methanomethylophilus sp.]
MMQKQNTTTTLSDIPIPETARFEWQVLSDIIQDNASMAAVMEIVNEGHFTSELRKGVWNECVRLFNEGSPFDLSSVALAVGPEFVQHIFNHDLVDDMGYRYAEEHARILHHATARRLCYKAGIEILGLSQEQGTTDASIYSRAAEAVARLEPTNAKREVLIIDALNTLAVEIERREKDKESGCPNRITTGISAVDDVLYGGMAPGNLVIVAARPSVGKTALSLHMMKAAAKMGMRAAMFSIEMTCEELAMRLVSSVSEEYYDENYGGLNDTPRRPIITPYKIANGFDTPEDWERFEAAVAQLDKLPIIVNDFARDLRDIVSRITVLNKQGLCDVAYIDYLGLIKQAAADPRAPLYQQIADITGTIKATAKSLRIPIVLLC